MTATALSLQGPRTAALRAFPGDEAISCDQRAVKPGWIGRSVGAADDRCSHTRTGNGAGHGMGDPVAADPRLRTLRSRAGRRFAPADEPAFAGRSPAFDRDGPRARGSLVVMLLCGCGARSLALPQ